MDDMNKHTTNQANDDELFSSSDDLFSRKSDTMGDEEFNFMDDFEDMPQEKAEPAFDDVLGGGTHDDFAAEDNFGEPKKSGGGMKKMLLIFVVLLLAGGVYYYLFGSDGEIEMPEKSVDFAAPKNKMPLMTDNELVEEVVAPETPTDERVKALELTLSHINEKLGTLQATEERLGKIEEVLQKLSVDAASKGQSLAELEQMSGRMTGVATLDQRMIALEKRVQAMHEEIELQTLAAARAQRSVNASKQVEQAMSSQPIGMVVQAAIPGRAWLLSDAGELLTVTRGDEVPGYGRVVSIDPVGGTVVMSSQAVFREE